MKNGGRISRSINRPDTVADVAWRRANNDARRIVDAERERRPAITAETALAELAWQEARIAELMAGWGFTR